MNLRLLFGLVITFAMVSCGGDLEYDSPDLPTPEDALEAKEAETGCTDPKAINFSDRAIEDDNSCFYTEKKQRSMFIKFTGTWCWACGDYGAIETKKVAEKHGDDVVIFEAHKVIGSDPMANAISEAWKTHWDHGNTPSFVTNNNLTQGGDDADIEATNSKDAEITFLSNYTADGVKISGTVYAQAEAELSGTYNVGIYMIGQNLIHKQEAGEGNAYPTWEYIKKDGGKGVYPDYIHHDILFGEANSEAFGTVAFEGTTAAHTSTKIDFSVDYKEIWKEADHMDIAVIAWKKDGDRYQFVNVQHVSNN